MFEKYMKQCFELAKKGLGKTSPNPLVGCVVLDKDNNIISTGYHAKYGENHAERDALLKLKNGEEEGGTIIVNLEPCSHFGKTPPCVDLILERKLAKVVIAMRDPNPKVSGIDKLKNAGIEVIEHVLEDEAKELNEIFIKNMVEKKIFVATKTASTLDGKVATKTGDSKWITSEDARAKVYELRTHYDAVLTTSSTVIADNPNFKNDLKILLDRTLKVDTNLNFFKTGKIIIAHDESLKAPQSSENIEYLPCKVIKNKIDISELLEKLYNKNIRSIFAECGGTLNGYLLEKNLIDKLYSFIAPKVLGDSTGKSVFSGRSLEKIADCKNFEITNIEKLNKDILITLKKAISQ